MNIGETFKNGSRGVGVAPLNILPFLLTHLTSQRGVLDNVRIDPYPVVAIFRCQSSKVNDLFMSLQFADVVSVPVLPLLIADLFLLPCVRQDGVRRDMVIRNELFHLPIVRVEKPHAEYALGSNYFKKIRQSSCGWMSDSLRSSMPPVV